MQTDANAVSREPKRRAMREEQHRNGSIQLMPTSTRSHARDLLPMMQRAAGAECLAVCMLLPSAGSAAQRSAPTPCSSTEDRQIPASFSSILIIIRATGQPDTNNVSSTSGSSPTHKAGDLTPSNTRVPRSSVTCDSAHLGDVASTRHSSTPEDLHRCARLPHARRLARATSRCSNFQAELRA